MEGSTCKRNQRLIFWFMIETERVLEDLYILTFSLDCLKEFSANYKTKYNITPPAMQSL